MKTTLTVPTLSAVLLLLSIQRDLRWMLLGPNYSHRLYITIEVNLLLLIIAAVYYGTRKEWIVAVASVMLALVWLYVGAINSVV
jgi:hypothetical protein